MLATNNIQETFTSSDIHMIAFKKIVSNMDQPVLITNCINQIVWANDSYTRKMGFTLEESLGRQDFHLFRGPETSDTDIDNIKAGICAVSCVKNEMNLYRKSGAKWRAAFEKEPFFDAEGRFRGFFIIINDIEPGKSTEAMATRQNMQFGNWTLNNTELKN